MYKVVKMFMAICGNFSWHVYWVSFGQILIRLVTLYMCVYDLHMPSGYKEQKRSVLSLHFYPSKKKKKKHTHILKSSIGRWLSKEPPDDKKRDKKINNIMRKKNIIQWDYLLGKGRRIWVQVEYINCGLMEILVSESTRRVRILTNVSLFEEKKKKK